MDFGKIMTITLLVFALLTLTFNFLKKPFYIPGDFYFDHWGIKFYLPIVSTLVGSIALTFFLSMLPK